MPEPAATPPQLTDAELLDAQQRAGSVDEILAIGRVRRTLAEARLEQAVRDFIVGSLTYVDIIAMLEESRRAIGDAQELTRLLERARALQIDLNAAEHGTAPATGDTDIASDEDKLPFTFDRPDTALDPVAPIRAQPRTLDSRDYSAALADEYRRFFLGAVIRSERAALVERCADTALAHRAHYEAVGRELAIPWWFIAGTHMMESTFNFGAHLHNGDSLRQRTHREPPNRPAQGRPPFSWEESAVDALKLKRLDGLSDWSLPRALYRWEKYNGFGYRAPRVPSPYLWSFSSVYEAGKYVRDHVFDAAAISGQCGAAVLLKCLNQRGEVALDFDAQEESGAFDPADDRDNVRPPLDADDTPFGRYWRDQLGDIRHFKPAEFLYKGASHASNGLNADPPDTLWTNIVPLVRVLERVRAEIGKPVKLLSVYRNAAYNRSVGGRVKPGNDGKNP